MKILVVTACGAKKHSEPMEAYKLYKSARIKAVFNRRCGCDMKILSAKYGLIDVFNIIEPYEIIMNEKRALKLIPLIVNIIKKYNYIVFFKGGSNNNYLTCIKGACKKARIVLITLGFANMGGINDLSLVIEYINKKGWDKISKINHVEIHERSILSI